jgi:hypothetical protein
MDSNRFDAFARTLSAGRSRRGVTRLVGGLALAGPAALLALLGSDAKRKKRKKKKKKTRVTGCSSDRQCTGGRVCRAGSCECPLAAPHWCGSANACVPACPTGMVFDPAFCGCDCAVRRSCCQCTGGNSPFCTTEIDNPIFCAAECSQRNPGGTPFIPALASADMTGTCNASGRCDVTCAPVSFTTDACQQSGGRCQGDLQPFQPLGGGPPRCGRSTNPIPSCGCTSHQQCADNHGAGAFCVQITGNQCNCGGASTFCATQA